MSVTTTIRNGGGTNFGTQSSVDSNVTCWFRDANGLLLAGTFTGSTPTTAGEYQVGCQLTKTDASSTACVYENQGTVASPNFALIGAGGGSGITQLTGLVTAGPGSGFQATTVHLLNEHIFMGNGSNIAVDYKVSQDLSTSGGGAFSVVGWDGNPLDSSFTSFAGAGVLPFWNTTTWSTGYLNGDITIASGVSYSVTGLLGFPLNAAVGTPSTGDILYYNGTSWNVLPVGTDGQVLTLAGGVPTWA